MNDTYQDRAEAYADAWFNWDNCESEAQASHTHGLTQNPKQNSYPTSSSQNRQVRKSV